MNEDQFREKVLSKKGQLYRFALRIVGNRHDAEDATSETILRLWSKRTELDRYMHLDRAVFTVVRNVSIDLIRRRKKLRLLEDSNDGLLEDPKNESRLKSKYDVVEKIIRLLPDKQRTAVHLRMTEGYTIRQIADFMDEKVNTVEVTLSRARKKIREEYAKYQLS